MKRQIFTFALLASCVGIWNIRAGYSAAITGRNFSIGLGFSQENDSFHINGPVTWNDLETDGSNTDSVLTPFSFSPTVTGALFAGRGPGFQNRQLNDGGLEFGSTNNKVGFLGGDFEVAIEASYSGSTGRVNPDNPDYRLEIEITGISIYAGAFDGPTAPDWPATPTLQWFETTPGHQGPIGSPTELRIIRDASADYQTAANYTQVTTDPDDYRAKVSSRNDSFTRTFTLSPNKQGNNIPWSIGDGFEVTGRVRLFYNAFGEQVQPSCDFNGDGNCTAADVDQLIAQINAKTNASGFDLTNDSQVNTDDLTEWRTSAAQKNGLAAPYLLGDANLDGSVTTSDLNALALNWRRTPNTWSGGDFTAAGSVNAANLNALAVNWTKSVPMAARTLSPQPIPEPSGFIGLIVAGGLITVVRRSRSRHVELPTLQ